MSSSKRDELVQKIGFSISRWQDAVETFDETVGAIYKLNSAERRCLSLVSHGPQTASAIAKETALTPAAITSLIDRLEARGFVRRTADANDRRKVMVEAASKTLELVEAIYQPIFMAGAEILSKYSINDMNLLLKFINEVSDMQDTQTVALKEKIRSSEPPERRSPGK